MCKFVFVCAMSSVCWIPVDTRWRHRSPLAFVWPTIRRVWTRCSMSVMARVLSRLLETTPARSGTYFTWLTCKAIPATHQSSIRVPKRLSASAEARALTRIPHPVRVELLLPVPLESKLVLPLHVRVLSTEEVSVVRTEGIVRLSASAARMGEERVGCSGHWWQQLFVMPHDETGAGVVVKPELQGLHASADVSHNHELMRSLVEDSAVHGVDRVLQLGL